MKLIRENCCCFTGHRLLSGAEAPRLRRRLREEILGLYAAGVDTFLAGGALGFDTLAAREVLSLREEEPGLHLVLVLPCLDQDRLWRPDQQERYRALMARADEVIYTDDLYSREAMLLRNRYLVDHSGTCLCYLRQTSRGGTAYTVRLARARGLRVVNLAQGGEPLIDEDQASLFVDPEPDPDFYPE